MPTTVDLVDLDVLAPVDRTVKLHGEKWRVPGDPPTGWLLTFKQLSAELASDEVDELVVVEQLRDAIADLFLLRQPDREEDVLRAVDSLGVPALVQAVNAIYAGQGEDVTPDPPKPRATGTRNTTARNRTRSASSSSSAS